MSEIFRMIVKNLSHGVGHDDIKRFPYHLTEFFVFIFIGLGKGMLPTQLPFLFFVLYY